MTPARAVRAFAVVLVALTAGCTSAPPEGGVAPSASEDAAHAAPPVVVAVVDTGINPYHAHFRGGRSFDEVSGFPADAARIDLTLDAADYAAAVAADKSEWTALAPERLVVFPGTRVAAISFGLGAPDSEQVVLDDHGHGTATADSVVEAAPHALIVSLQIDDDERIADAVRWAAAQSWIDLVSVSWGKAATEYAEETMMGLADAYREAARAGKILVNSAGNEPLVHWTDEHNGPPFVIAVGGALNATKGERRTAARFPDVIAAYDQVRAVAGTLDETAPISGTSFSCPTVAGTLAHALWLVRDAVGAATGGTDADGDLVAAAAGAGALDDGAITAEEVRDAMNRRAEYWGPTDWSPGTDPDNVVRSNPILHPAAQMGYGFVEPAQAADVAAHLLGEQELPSKSADVEAFMSLREAARFAMWGGK